MIARDALSRRPADVPSCSQRAAAFRCPCLQSSLLADRRLEARQELRPHAVLSIAAVGLQPHKRGEERLHVVHHLLLKSRDLAVGALLDLVVLGVRLPDGRLALAQLELHLLRLAVRGLSTDRLGRLGAARVERGDRALPRVVGVLTRRERLPALVQPAQHVAQRLLERLALRVGLLAQRARREVRRHAQVRELRGERLGPVLVAVRAELRECRADFRHPRRLGAVPLCEPLGRAVESAQLALEPRHVRTQLVALAVADAAVGKGGGGHAERLARPRAQPVPAVGEQLAPSARLAGVRPARRLGRVKRFIARLEEDLQRLGMVELDVGGDAAHKRLQMLSPTLDELGREIRA
mmetsp:Transcript_5429/g.17048  ORF Transcript_5429/g.17048 Transcript_5429/m.17048 type:complete len:352 (-) Transcript_5429:587-1642(-)